VDLGGISCRVVEVVIRDRLAPGEAQDMNHSHFSAMMGRTLRPRSYIEVGIAEGASLFVDPIPEFVVSTPTSTNSRPQICEN
jgi:hypothetical protein